MLNSSNLKDYKNNISVTAKVDYKRVRPHTSTNKCSSPQHNTAPMLSISKDTN